MSNAQYPGRGGGSDANMKVQLLAFISVLKLTLNREKKETMTATSTYLPICKCHSLVKIQITGGLGTGTFVQ